MVRKKHSVQRQLHFSYLFKWIFYQISEQKRRRQSFYFYKSIFIIHFYDIPHHFCCRSKRPFANRHLFGATWYYSLFHLILKAPDVLLCKSAAQRDVRPFSVNGTTLNPPPTHSTKNVPKSNEGKTSFETNFEEIHWLKRCGGKIKRFHCLKFP